MTSPPNKVLRWPFVVAGVLIALTPLGIAIWGYLQAFSVVGGESVDPSQKAVVLAEGISNAMNGLASAIVCIPLGAGLILYGVMRKRAKPQLPQPSDS